MLTRRRTPLMLAAAALVCGSALALSQPQGAPPPGAQVPGPDLGAMLLAGLGGTEGCLGADAAQLQSGKVAIMAWFENAEAARRWYHDPMHRRLVSMAGADPDAGRPLEHVDDDTPVMVIAALTFTDRPMIEGIPMPISQISIELYTPLPGGAMINGRLAPEGFRVEHMRNLNAAGPYDEDGAPVETP